jgi:hypothetical protein
MNNSAKNISINNIFKDNLIRRPLVNFAAALKEATGLDPGNMLM